MREKKQTVSDNWIIQLLLNHI